MPSTAIIPGIRNLRQMPSKYKIGFVVGKFCPLHKGHEYLINTAIANCDQVFILSYTSQKFPNCSVANRTIWLTTLFPNCIIRVLEDCPDDNADEVIHREFCTKLIEETVGSVDAIFTSETYGIGFAEYVSNRLGKKVKHHLVDLDRIQVPISGTKMRNSFDPNMCSPVVAKSFTKKIAILGGESSGKSTLAKALGKALNCPVVEEYGREYCDMIGGVDKLQLSDMVTIARQHCANEDSQMGSKYLVCDTTPLVTKWYSEQLFGKVEEELEILSKREYDYYFLCCNDFPFVQDGTRQDEEFRSKGFTYFKKNLPRFHLIYGSIGLGFRTYLAITALGEEISYFGPNKHILFRS